MAGRRERRVFLIFMVLLAIPAALVAQTVSATTGAMNGKAIDKTGAVLPGVTVTIASPSLMGTRTAVTGGDGTYRFPAIPPGDYSVMFELSGFGAVKHEGIRVALRAPDLEERLGVRLHAPVLRHRPYPLPFPFPTSPM